MQTSNIYLYPNKLDIYTNLDTWVLEGYRAVYQRNLKIYRGADNRVEFRVKNSDQKPTNITGRVFVFSLISKETQELVCKLDCTSVNPAQGRLFLDIPKEVMQTIDAGMYNYTIVAETREYIDFDTYVVKQRVPVYADSQYGVHCVIEVHGDVNGEFTPSEEAREFLFYAEYLHNTDYYQSELIEPYSTMLVPQSVHTFQLFCEKYTGQIVIEASLDRSATPHRWATIKTIDCIELDNTYVNVTGQYRWFRVKHYPKHIAQFGEFKIRQTIFGYYEVDLVLSGRGHRPNTKLVIPGRNLGGETPTNDLILTVEDVNKNGEIVAFSHTGLSYNGVREFVIDGTQRAMQGRINKIMYR